MVLRLVVNGSWGGGGGGVEGGVLPGDVLWHKLLMAWTLTRDGQRHIIKWYHVKRLTTDAESDLISNGRWTGRVEGGGGC